MVEAVDREWDREFEHKGIKYEIGFSWKDGNVPSAALVKIPVQQGVSGAHAQHLSASWSSEAEALDQAKAYAAKYIDTKFRAD
ncbi:hypothetical protein FXN65_10610 [Metapseudomonas lalkuanensis]|uniref:Uncharacterized protein n=1 Tax=Metapseudomonas lalkuanensis TaxID=2604832 RepID=A0A5J6QL66_9GAMM|nr:hypothetical protein [Pseudomonas lalkuanensis]QEY62505.1 hypothetical protein FXN65_10610 [Pseudomonas lalkuanensis]